ncbi:MAG: aminodeoxychorismate lyase [Xanthomonadales bacterium]|jgi:4-amino-4-deoxychorismate lyase|nr:aminodeoxychorismate lyase [Xanthomonadales bacterium]
MFSCLVDGALATHVPADDRGLAYGDGMFETLAVVGGKPRLWQGHVDRLRRGGERLGIPVPPQEVLLREVQTVAAGQPQCIVKIVLTRGSGGRGYAPPESPEPRRIVSAHGWPDGLEADRRDGVHAALCETRLAIQPLLRGIKHLNRLEQVLAAAESPVQGGRHGIVRNTEGFVICGVSANLFLVSEGQLLTPRMDRSGVHGVLRGLLLREHAARTERRRVSLDLLAEADELFFCSAIRGIVPIVSLAGAAGEVRDYPIGPVTLEMQAWCDGVFGRG